MHIAFSVKHQIYPKTKYTAPVFICNFFHGIDEKIIRKDLEITKNG